MMPAIMACDEYKALLPEYVSGELSPEQVRLLKDHLPACDSCRETIRLLRLDDDAVRRMLFGAGQGQWSGGDRSRLVRYTMWIFLILFLSLIGLFLSYYALRGRLG